jgi:hypothetical protein
VLGQQVFEGDILLVNDMEYKLINIAAKFKYPYDKSLQYDSLLSTFSPPRPLSRHHCSPSPVSLIFLLSELITAFGSSLWFRATVWQPIQGSEGDKEEKKKEKKQKEKGKLKGKETKKQTENPIQTVSKYKDCEGPAHYPKETIVPYNVLPSYWNREKTNSQPTRSIFSRFYFILFIYFLICVNLLLH